MSGRPNSPRVDKLVNSLVESRAKLMSNAIVLMDSYAEFISEDKVQSQHLPLLRILMVVCLQVDAVYLQIWGLLSFEDMLALHRKLISRTTGTMISKDNADAFRTIMFENSSSTCCCR